MKIELYGVEVFGHHGATEAEEREGQTFLFDIALWPRRSRTPTTSSTRSTTARWRRASVRSSTERVRLLETLAASLADELISRFAVERSVCVRKPQVQLDPPRRAFGRHRRTAVTTTYVGLGSNSATASTRSGRRRS